MRERDRSKRTIPQGKLAWARRKGREYALFLLFQEEMNPMDRKEALSRFREWDGIDYDDNCTEEGTKDYISGFGENLFGQSMERRQEIDKEIVSIMKNWDLNRLKSVDRNILRLAACEILFREDVPPAVSINEAVEIAKSFSGEESGRFVNGILDKIRKVLEGKQNSEVSDAGSTGE